MSVQMRFFLIPMRSLREAEEELNHFLGGVRVVHIHREFVDQGDNSFWSIAVEYLTGDSAQAGPFGGGKQRGRVDYKEVLSPEEFALFAMLRDWRKQKAAEEAVPVYQVFTNHQLATMVERGVTSKSELMEIEGIGEGRVEKYGESVIEILSREGREKGDKAEE